MSYRETPTINQDRRIIDFFALPYDEYCTPYDQVDFSKTVKSATVEGSVVKLQPCKVIFIGDVCVGKTTIVNSFCHNIFQNLYKATIGVDFEVENFQILDQTFNLQIWDTAGQERFKCIAQAYYRNAHVIVVVFDMTNEDSLRAVPKWLESAYYVNNIQRPLVFMVGTKSDLLTKDKYNQTEYLAYEIARKIQAEYWSVSAKTGFNIVELFQRIASLSFESLMRQNIVEAKMHPKQARHGQEKEDWLGYVDCKKKSKLLQDIRCFC